MTETEAKAITAKEIYNLPHEKIDAIQNLLDRKNVREIETAYHRGRLNEEEKDYLLEFYRDGMAAEREVYRSLYETFGQPEKTCAFDPTTGKVDVDAHGNEINYGLKVVTPFTDTRLEYVDKNNNPIRAILPKMKKAERAIEKLKDEYGKDCNRHYVKALDNFFKNEDRDFFVEKLQELPRTTTKLHDILRLTITAKYLSDVQRLKRKLSENKTDFFFVEKKETRDRFELPLSENQKKYYDIKMIMHHNIPNGKILDVEVQLKVDTLYMGDICTHALYEEVRKSDAPDAKAKIKTVNESHIHQYNMMVLDKARRVEDDGYRPLRLPPENADGTYKRCCDFISNEYLPESYERFDGKTAFNADTTQNKLCFLRMIGKLQPDFDMFSKKAAHKINSSFALLEPAEIERFNGINEVASRYQMVVQRTINSKKRSEPQMAVAISRAAKTK